MVERVFAPDHKLTASFVRRAPVVASLLGPPRLSKPAVNLCPVTSTINPQSDPSIWSFELWYVPPSGARGYSFRNRADLIGLTYTCTVRPVEFVWRELEIIEVL